MFTAKWTFCSQHKSFVSAAHLGGKKRRKFPFLNNIRNFCHRKSEQKQIWKEEVNPGRKFLLASCKFAVKSFEEAHNRSSIVSSDEHKGAGGKFPLDSPRRLFVLIFPRQRSSQEALPKCFHEHETSDKCDRAPRFKIESNLLIFH